MLQLNVVVAVLLQRIKLYEVGLAVAWDLFLNYYLDFDLLLEDFLCSLDYFI
jgi:hypothetical protein